MFNFEEFAQLNKSKKLSTCIPEVPNSVSSELIFESAFMQVSILSFAKEVEYSEGSFWKKD